MARTLPKLGEEVVAQIEAAWTQSQPDWARRRLLVVRLIAQHELTVAEIMKIADVSRQTVFTYRDKVVAGGVAALLQRGKAPGNRPAVRGAVQTEFLERLAAGQFRRAKDAQAWIKKRTRKTLSESGALKVLRRLGGKLKVPRKSHAKKDPAKAAAFKVELPLKLEALAGPAARTGQPVRLWVLDEHRYGLLPVIRRVWGQRGVRVHAPYATRYQWGYLHEALEVDGANRLELLFTPCIDQDVHALFLQQLGATDPAALHVVIQDQAGFHLPVADPRLPKNVRLLPLPPYSPELNPVAKLGDLVKDRICNRLYPSLRRLEDHLLAALRPWRTESARVAELIGRGWLLDGVNAGAPT
ncbi:IS630 family transposase [Horticoccus sp. 23ND18S-11]